MNKNRVPFIPPLPHIDPPSQETIERLQNMSNHERKQFRKSDAYKKYVQPARNREKKRKRELQKDWWWNKGIVILNTILALIAAVTGIVALLR